MPRPKCGSDNKVNSGTVKEKQRYKCKQCGCNYTQSYQHGYRLDKKLLALQLYLKGNGLRATGRILGLSNVTVLNWIKQFGNSIKEYVLENMPNEIRDIEIVEIDEMWHFRVKKNENYGSGLRSTGWTRKSLPTPLAVAVRKPGKDYLAYSIAIAWFKWRQMDSRCTNKLSLWNIL